MDYAHILIYYSFWQFFRNLPVIPKKLQIVPAIMLKKHLVSSFIQSDITQQKSLNQQRINCESAMWSMVNHNISKFLFNYSSIIISILFLTYYSASIIRPSLVVINYVQWLINACFQHVKNVQRHYQSFASVPNDGLLQDNDVLYIYKRYLLPWYCPRLVQPDPSHCKQRK